MKIRWYLVIIPLAAAALMALAQEGMQTLTGFSVPEYDKDGNMLSQLFGDFAEFLPDGIVKISNLKIEFYKEGDVDMRVTAPQCNYDQDGKTAESESNVRIARGNMVVTGEGFKWDAGEERLEIHNKAKVVLKDVRKHVQAGEVQ